MIGVVVATSTQGQNIGYVIANEEIDGFLRQADGQPDGQPSIDAALTGPVGRPANYGELVHACCPAAARSYFNISKLFSLWPTCTTWINTHSVPSATPR
jgi:hypothetical protein